ncbi:MAG: arsenite-transporting ATPase, partial [Methylococcaceae bacterium NSP1-2]
MAIGLSEQYLVVNGMLPSSEIAEDSLATALYQREQQALATMPAILQTLPCDYIELKPFNMVGLQALRLLLTTATPLTTTSDISTVAVELPNLSTLVNDIAIDGHGLVMLMGKGGVGKTTLAAAVAVELAQRGLAVHLTTSDPAAHLSETLNGALDNLTVSRIDPLAETERYRQHILQTKGAKLDAQGKALLEEDLR